VDQLQRYSLELLLSLLFDVSIELLGMRKLLILNHHIVEILKLSLSRLYYFQDGHESASAFKHYFAAQQYLEGLLGVYH